MPTPLYVLVEAGAFGLLVLAVLLAGGNGWPRVAESVTYASFFIVAVALGLVAMKWGLARSERRRARSPWAGLGGTVELGPLRPLARTLATAAFRTLFMLGFAWLMGFFRPPIAARVTPVAALLKARRERRRNPAPL